MLKISEVYEKRVKKIGERPDGSEFVSHETEFATRDCLVNEQYIVAVYPHEFSSDLDRKKVEYAFPENTKFSTLILNGNSFRKSEILVVGSFDKLSRELGENKK